MSDNQIVEVQRLNTVFNPAWQEASNVRRPVSAAASERVDEVRFSDRALEVAELVEQTRQLPEVRPELVVHFREQVKGGLYPPPSLVDGLAALIGNAFRRE